MNMDDDVREKVMRVPEKEMELLADVCNRYPMVEMSFQEP